MTFTEIIAAHPNAPNPFGVHLSAVDEQTDHGVPHRVLGERVAQSVGFTTVMRDWLITHHASPEMQERDRRRREAMTRLGFGTPPNQLGLFPTNPNTQKGNWAEILLAEYLGHSCNARVPVYRLHCNPNVDQSMKGDDVLAFDLDSQPVRILVGEAKFRSTPTRKAVEDIVEALTKSHRVGIPVSLQFVVNRLFALGQAELGAKVDECSLLFALGQLRLDYLGLLVSDANAPVHVRRNATPTMRRLAVLSLGLDDPEGIVSTCYQGLEN